MRSGQERTNAPAPARLAAWGRWIVPVVIAVEAVLLLLGVVRSGDGVVVVSRPGTRHYRC
ncbi:hypothetical protein GCM10023108_08150 [Saccharopolyspora hordei]